MNNQNKFKAGDLVYCPVVGSRIYELNSTKNELSEKYADLYPICIKVGERHTVYFDYNGKMYKSGVTSLFLATEEEYYRLRAFYNQYFQKPKIQFTSLEIIEHLLGKQEYVPCYVSNGKEKSNRSNSAAMIVSIEEDDRGYCYKDDTGEFWRYATALNVITGLPITEIEE